MGETIGQHINSASKRLMAAGIDNYNSEAKILMMFLLNVSPSDLFMQSIEELDDVTARRYKKLVDKRMTHYPLQYIIGFTYFMDYRFSCKEGVLIPRYDTENVVLDALSIAPDRKMRVLDMCTGSGCIGISFYKQREEMGYNDKVIMSDISPEALELASKNAAENDADVRVIESDLFDAFNEDYKFDMIISNPPYIKTEDIWRLDSDVKDYEPMLALDGMEDGLYFYREIIGEAPKYLKKDGCLVLEIGFDQADDVGMLLEKTGFKDITIKQDLSGLDRVAHGWI